MNAHIELQLIAHVKKIGTLRAGALVVLLTELAGGQARLHVVPDPPCWTWARGKCCAPLFLRGWSMPRDLRVIARDFPTDPDWLRLQCFWTPPGLLHFDARLGDIPSAGLAYLATPLSAADGGPVLAADQAVEWVWQLGRVGVYAISPAMLAQAMAEAGGPKPEPLAALALSDHIVVPPMAGWQSSIEVWRAVCAALDANMPVYVLAEQAGAV